MQPIAQLQKKLDQIVSKDRYVFSFGDIHSWLAELSVAALKTLLSRAVKAGIVKRACKGIYYVPSIGNYDGRLLYRIAARLRADEFNYLSLESVLSDAGVISQVPIQYLTLLSSGRNYCVDCGELGRIEFVHTKKQPADLAAQLTYDKTIHMWRASVALAIKDMKATKRSLDLIQWEVVNELI